MDGMNPMVGGVRHEPHVFYYEGTAMPRDELCDLLDKIAIKRDEVSLSRHKCHKDLEGLRAATKSLRKATEDMFKAQKNNTV